MLGESQNSKYKTQKPKKILMLKTNLVEKDLIIEKTVKTGRGRPSKILKLTEKGYQILVVEKKGTPAHHGGREHRMMVNEIAGLLTSMGYNTEIEESCDIKASNDDETLAFEVETFKNFNNEQIMLNINRNLKWASDIVITCPNSKYKGRIMRLIKIDQPQKREKRQRQMKRDLELTRIGQKVGKRYCSTDVFWIQYTVVFGG